VFTLYAFVNYKTCGWCRKFQPVLESNVAAMNDRARAAVRVIDLSTPEGKATQQAYMNWVTEFETKAVANLRAQGGNVVPISAPELAKWRAAAPDFLAEWEKATAAATGDAETPRKVAARWRELIGK
jgi:hypothetical protein